MAENEFSVLKTHIEELLKSIEGIDKEAASFSAAKTELVEIAKNLHKISGDLAQAVKTSEAVLNQVESIAVTSTLRSMKSSAEKYAENIENYFRQTKVANAELAQEIQSRIDSSNADTKKKLLIIGGISIAVSLIALVVAFI
jgi:hypothetical protein